jgi:hypothetical protein
MKDLIEEGKLILVYVPTDELVADILTKPMLGRKFQYLLFKLIGWSQTMVDDNYIDKSLSCMRMQRDQSREPRDQSVT